MNIFLCRWFLNLQSITFILRAFFVDFVLFLFCCEVYFRFVLFKIDQYSFKKGCQSRTRLWACNRTKWECRHQVFNRTGNTWKNLQWRAASASTTDLISLHRAPLYVHIGVIIYTRLAGLSDIAGLLPSLSFH